MRQVKCLEQEIESEESGFGTLKTERGGLPLAAMDVRARIVGLAAEIRVRQTFRNALSEALEATYIFPLPDRAAVTAFRMEVAGRVIEGDLKERREAREEYDKAIEAGHRAAIAEEERSGVFTLRVGNIPAKEEVRIELTLAGPVAVVDGEATFRFPLVAAPRYVPGIPLDGPPVGAGWGPDTDQAPDASRVTPPVLLPGFPNPVRLSLEVEIDPAGLGPQSGDVSELFRVSLHRVVVEQGPPWTVRLQPGERLDRDFILRYPVVGESLQATLVCSPGAAGQAGTFALTLVPPAVEAQALSPRDVVIVLDRSGSMEGWKMVAARRAVGRMVDTLLEHDRFSVLAFDNSIEFPPHADRGLAEATNQNRWRALEWLGKIEARGGTEMGPAVVEAVRLVHATQNGRRAVIVLITDGQVAGEDSILKSIKSAAGANMPRIHTLGIDQAVNEGFSHRLAELGRGTCDCVESEARLDEAMDRIHRSIGAPLLIDLKLRSEGCELVADGLAPSRLPELFSGQPATTYGRYLGEASQCALRLEATDAAGRPWSATLAASPRPAAGLLNLWGRAKVRELEDRYAAGVSDPKALAAEIVKVSLESRVLSRFTAYVAVDRSEVVNQGGTQQHILQPVEMPAGWGEAGTQVMFACAAPACPAAPLRRARRARGLGAIASKFVAGFGGPQEFLAEDDFELSAMPTIEDTVEKLRDFFRSKPGPGRTKSKSLAVYFTALVGLLADLVSTLRASSHPSLAQAEKALKDGQDYLAGLTAKHTVPDAAELRNYFARLVALLDEIDRPSQAARTEFWT